MMNVMTSRSEVLGHTPICSSLRMLADWSLFTDVNIMGMYIWATDNYDCVKCMARDIIVSSNKAVFTFSQKVFMQIQSGTFLIA